MIPRNHPQHCNLSNNMRVMRLAMRAPPLISQPTSCRFSTSTAQSFIIGRGVPTQSPRGGIPQSYPKFFESKNLQRPDALLSAKRYASRKYTRQERINEARYTSQSNLDKIDEIFDIYHKNVTKVVDLGSAPGTWLRHSRNRLSYLHGSKPEEIHEKCVIVGVDLLFCQPPRGTFFTQGNIYSQNTHTQVENLLIESTYRLSRPKADKLSSIDLEMSYISRELNEIQLEQSMGNPKSNMSDSKNTRSKNWHPLPQYAHQADLVLSDLGTPPLQEAGFHINTYSKPFIRGNSNKMLRKPWDEPEKASIDLAEAALLLCGQILAKGGTFVVRLSMVNLADPELLLLESRLGMAFNKITRWSDNGRTFSEKPRSQSLFLVCEDKKDHTMDKYAVFGIDKEPATAS